MVAWQGRLCWPGPAEGVLTCPIGDGSACREEHSVASDFLSGEGGRGSREEGSQEPNVGIGF